MVDGAILDVGNFSRRHPGGARVIVNALGTDITSELKGEDLKGEDVSAGYAMSFSSNQHSEVREHSNREDASIDVAGNSGPFNSVQLLRGFRLVRAFASARGSIIMFRRIRPQQRLMTAPRPVSP